MTPRPPTGPRRRASSGMPLRSLMSEDSMASNLDVTLVSDLRMIQIQIDGLRGLMREGFTIKPDQIALLASTSLALSKTIAEVSIWTEEIRAQRYAKQTASMKASLTRTLTAPLLRRRRR